MSSLWDSLYSVFARTRNNLVDPPGEENPENPELAITGEGRGATTGVPTWGTDRVVTTQPAKGVHSVTEAVVSSTTPEDAQQQQQQSPSIIVPDSRGAPTFNLFDMSVQTPRGAPAAWGDADAQPQPDPQPSDARPQPHPQQSTSTGCAHRSRPRERHLASHCRRCSSSRSSSPGVRRHHRIRPQQFNGAGSFESFWANFENCASTMNGQRLTSWRISRLR